MSFEKTNIPGLVKDTEHGVIINEDDSEYQRILDKRKHSNELSDVQSEVLALKKELQGVEQLKAQIAAMQEFMENFKEKQ